MLQLVLEIIFSECYCAPARNICNFQHFHQIIYSLKKKNHLKKFKSKTNQGVFFFVLADNGDNVPAKMLNECETSSIVTCIGRNNSKKSWKCFSVPKNWRRRSIRYLEICD